MTCHGLDKLQLFCSNATITISTGPREFNRVMNLTLMSAGPVDRILQKQGLRLVLNGSAPMFSTYAARRSSRSGQGNGFVGGRIQSRSLPTWGR
jgi:hypothetical protein